MFETQFTKVNIPRSIGFILWSTLCVCVIWKPTTQSATYIFTKEKWLVESSLAKTFVTRVLCTFWNRTFLWSLCECVYWAFIFSIITHISFTIDIFSWLSLYLFSQPDTDPQHNYFAALLVLVCLHCILVVVQKSWNPFSLSCICPPFSDFKLPLKISSCSVSLRAFVPLMSSQTKPNMK